MIERIAFIVQCSVFTCGISRMIEPGAEATCGVEAASYAYQSNRIQPISVLEDPSLWVGGHQPRRVAMR
jgi:hypothetical protein